MTKEQADAIALFLSKALHPTYTAQVLSAPDGVAEVGDEYVVWIGDGSDDHYIIIYNAE